MSRRHRLAAAGYVACMAAYVYGVYDRGLYEDDDAFWVVVLVGLTGLHLATGYLSAVFLPLVTVIVSLPAELSRERV